MGPFATVGRRVRRLTIDHRATRIGAGPAAGLRIGTLHASARYADGGNELPVQQAVTSLLAPGDVFYDVGANVGFFSMLAGRLVGRTGSVVAFEAVPAVARALRANARRNGLRNVDVRAVAVGAVDGVARLRLTSHPGGASLADDDDVRDVTGAVDVPVIRLDSLVAAGDAAPPDVVKIDVEGHEAAVLDGMRDVLRTASPALVIELDSATASGLDVRQRAVDERLGAAGYGAEVLPRSYADAGWEVRHLVARRR